ncbi:hypothetical protein ES703_113506 [subsurface metagenome]
MVNTASAVAMASVMVIQYHVDLEESRYAVEVEGGVSFLVKWILSCFSSSISALVICSLGNAVFSCRSLISCSVVSGF